MGAPKATETPAAAAADRIYDIQRVEMLNAIVA